MGINSDTLAGGAGEWRAYENAGAGQSGARAAGLVSCVLGARRSAREHERRHEAPGCYSYRRAVIGSIIAARRAGQTPKTTPTSAEKTKASSTEEGATSVFQWKP